MIPKVAGKGASFKGAGLYYLHDKNAQTKERVAFTHTQNLPTDDPELAIRLMAHTAINQAKIKAANDNTVKTGRKLQKPVYAYSLSWSPDEAPTPAEMIAAAHETLDVLGLAGHEVLMVSHNDEPHPHIHVIVNRVHPETGLAAKLSNDHLKLSRWAEAYEKSHGKIRCEQRVENNEKRRRGQFVKDRQSTRKAQFHEDRKMQLRQAFERQQLEQKSLSAYHTGQRQFLYDEKEAHIRAAREEVRAGGRPKWAALYKRQRTEKQDLKQMQRKAWTRLVYWLKNRDKQDRAFLAGAITAIMNRGLFDKQLADRHHAERKALAAEIQKTVLAAIQHENNLYKREMEKLEQLQGKETEDLKTLHTRESEKGAKDSDRTSQSPTLTAEFTKRARRRMRRRRKREERSRGPGREHDL